jgi:hypothetical protein
MHSTLLLLRRLELQGGKGRRRNWVIFGRGIKVSLVFSIVFFASGLLNLEVDDERTDDWEIREVGEGHMEEGMSERD